MRVSVLCACRGCRVNGQGLRAVKLVAAPAALCAQARALLRLVLILALALAVGLLVRSKRELQSLLQLLLELRGARTHAAGRSVCARAAWLRVGRMAVRARACA